MTVAEPGADGFDRDSAGWADPMVIDEPGDPSRLRPARLPIPSPELGQVLVNVEATGVNPVDVANRADPSWARIEPSYVVGYELAGVVEPTGADAGVSPGDLVWWCCRFKERVGEPAATRW
jgi:NADPH:quinone reductase-like Zn-dependent oxidoreductase